MANNVKSVTATALGTSSPTSFNAVSGWPPLVTSSMINWNKSLNDLPSSELSYYNEGPRNKLDDKKRSEEGSFNAEMKFSIDEEEMFVSTTLASTADSEYFVVL